MMARVNRKAVEASVAVRTPFGDKSLIAGIHSRPISSLNGRFRPEAAAQADRQRADAVMLNSDKNRIKISK
jgi:hypothetical protein